MALVATRFKHTANLRRAIEDSVRADVDVDGLVAQADASVPANFDGQWFSYCIPAELAWDGKEAVIYFEAEELVTAVVGDADGSIAQLYDFD